MAGVKRSLGAMLGHQANHRDEYQDHRQELKPAEPPEPSPTFPPLTGPVPEFSPDASVLLVGIRGAGKSTLAVMASSAMKRRVIDLETAFQRTSGVSSAGYRAQHGLDQCHRQQAKVLEAVLERNPTECIIVCSWMERRVQALLRDFAASCPVIHVVRDADAIQDHLKLRDGEKVRNLLGLSNAIFRTCTNFEFFNVSEKTTDAPTVSLSHRVPAPYLALKHVERHFLKFLSLVFPAGTFPFIESAFPLANIPPEQRQFTYAVSVPLSDVLRSGPDIEEHVTGADVFQIVVHELAEPDPVPDPDPAAPVHHVHHAETCASLAGDISKAIGIVRRSTILPIIVHIFLPHAAREGVVRLYLDLLSHVLRLAPEMMTVDLRLDDASISRVLTAKKRTKIVGNRYVVEDPPPWESPAWVAWYKKATSLGCDLVRLLRPALAMEDNFSIARLRAAVDAMDGPRAPLITYNTGALGRSSAAFNRILTVVRPESMAQVHALPPILPCITALAATTCLFSSFVYDEMKLYVFGANVDYSLSPAMHNSALWACGMRHRYEPFSATSLRAIRHLIEDPSFGGASVGLPFKVEVITLTHSLSSHARAIGAVNTLIPIRQLHPDGSVPTGAAFFDSVGRAGPIRALYGENTDWVGIRACIRRGLSPANAVVASTCGLVIGAGGMARATVYAMLQIGITNIVIFNRTPSNAERLVAHFDQLLRRQGVRLLSEGSRARFHVMRSLDEEWPSSFRLPTVIVSCIPTHRIGDVPAPDFTVPDAWLGSKTGGVVIELAYKTLSTPLLGQAREEASRGWVTMDGLDLLPEQGFAQFELFTGRRAPRRVMRREVFRASPSEEEGGSNSEHLRPRLQSIGEQEGS